MPPDSHMKRLAQFGWFQGRVQHIAFSHNRLCKCLERIGRKLKVYGSPTLHTQQETQQLPASLNGWPQIHSDEDNVNMAAAT